MDNKIIKLLLVASLFIAMFAVFATIKLKFNIDGKRLYKQGMEYYNIQDYSNAYYNFKQIKRYSNIYSFALLKQFQCANNLQDKKTARLTLKELIKITKDENIRPYILYNDAILNQELNIDSTKKTQAKFKYIFEKYKENDFAYASSYRYAKLIESENETLAKEKYIDYLSYAPSGKFAKDTLSIIENFNNKFKKDDYDILANAFFENANYEKALFYYQKGDFSKNWVKISKCYKNLNNTTEEINTIKNAITLKASEVEEKDISYAIERLISTTHSDKIQTLQDIYTYYPTSYVIPTVEYKLAESLTSIRSIKFYEDIVKNHPDSYWAGNALWELIWYNYRQKRFQTCEKLYEDYFLSQKNTQDAARISYWYAKALLNERKNQAAKEMFYKTIDDYPLSFYAFLSARQLKISKSKRIISKKSIANYDINSINKNLFKNSTLLLLADYDDWQTIEELKINNEYIKSWILNKKEQYPLSITTAKNEYEKQEKSSFDDWQLKLMYPVVFEDTINRKSKNYKRSPYLFLSLVREESHFNALAKSSVGALGLSQIMPSTADFITKSQISRNDLLNEEKNIEIGLKYFTYLVDYFNGNEFLAILGYNAGPGNINKWLKTRINDTGEIDMFIENVPFLETKNYIKKILSSYWVYMNVYSNKYI